MARSKGWATTLALAAFAVAGLGGCAVQPPPAAVATEATPQPRRPAPEKVASLIGVPGETLVKTLGNPVLRKAENGGEIWLYAHANGCSLDVVLVPVKKIPTVTHATTETPTRLSETECLSAIANIVP